MVASVFDALDNFFRPKTTVVVEPAKTAPAQNIDIEKIKADLATELTQDLRPDLFSYVRDVVQSTVRSVRGSAEPSAPVYVSVPSTSMDMTEIKDDLYASILTRISKQSERGANNLSSALSSIRDGGSLASTTLTNTTLADVASSMVRVNANGLLVAAVADTDYVATTTGDWAGTLNGLTASSIVAGAFSTTSAAYYLTSGTINVANMLHTGSTTLQDFTFTIATGTSATTTNLFSTTASSTNLFSSLLNIGGTGLIVDSLRNVGIGTTTSRWALQIASSSGPQLTLSDNSSFSNLHWSLRNAGGTFYLATSSASTFATSSINALMISSSGYVGIGLGTSTPGEKLEVVGNIISKGTEWTSRTSAADNSWRDITYGNGLFVAVATSGSGNRVMTSPDGVNWTTRTSAANSTWLGVTYGNGLFVAVAADGTGVMTSPDGITWTSRPGATNATWESVTYGNGLFVAVGQSGVGNRVMTSPDGITWTSRASAADNGWQSVTYGNGLFVAVANTGTGNRVMTSPDGITWTAQTSANNNNWESVTYGNGLFVAVASGAASSANQIMTSPDGVTWTGRTPASASSWRAITYGNGLFVAVAFGSTDVMTSPNGINWTLRTGAASNQWEGIAYGNGIFAAVSVSGTGNRVMTSGKQDTIAFSANNLFHGLASFSSFTGFGTTTPRWMVQIATSSGPQLTLSDNGSLTYNHWSFRNSGGTFYLATSSPSTFATSTLAALTVGVNGGLQVGNPTGADKGFGSINVSGDIYKNNTSYANPDYVLESWQTGRIVQFINNPGAATYPGIQSLDEVEAYARTHFQLPRIAAATGIFERGDVILEKIEEIFIHLFDMNHRIASTTDRLAALEMRVTLLNSASTTGPVVTDSSGFFSDLLNLGVQIAHGVATFGDIIAQKITAKHAVFDDLELKDVDTGGTYCVRIKSGALIQTPGTCDSSATSFAPSSSDSSGESVSSSDNASTTGSGTTSTVDSGTTSTSTDPVDDPVVTPSADPAPATETASTLTNI